MLHLAGLLSFDCDAATPRRRVDDLSRPAGTATRLFRAESAAFCARLVQHSFEVDCQQPASSPDGRYTALLDGELYDRPVSQALAELWNESEIPRRGPWEHWNGQFALAIYDRLRERLHLVTDRFGLRPVYYRRAPDGFAFGSRIESVLRLSRQPPALDDRGVASLLASGHHFGSATLFEGVHAVGPAMHLVVSHKEHKPFTYWLPSYRADPAVRASELADRLANAIRRQSTGKRVGLLLSGGLDSRVIASVASDAGARPCAFSYGRPDSMDVVYAGVVSRRLGLRHETLPFEPAEWWRKLTLAAWRAEGEAGIHHFRTIQSHGKLAEHCDTLLTGLSGDMIMGSFVRRDMLTPRPRSELIARALQVASDEDGADLASLLEPDVLALARASLRKHVEEDLRDAPRAPAADLLDAWNLRNRQRRFIAVGFATDRYRFRDRSPFYDYDLFDLVTRISPRRRFAEGLYLRALCELMPHLRDVPWQKTGRPIAPAPPIVLLARDTRLGRLFERARHIGSAGRERRNFASDGDLLRAAIGAAELRDLLTSPGQSWLQRVRKERVESLVAEHYAHRRDHANLLMKLLTLHYTESLFIRHAGDPQRP